MALTDTHHQSIHTDQAALVEYSSEGCLPFFAVPPLAVVMIGLLMALLLSRIDTTTSFASDTYDQNSFIAPYEDYTITQGLHGYSYGHMAIDISAGKGEVIRSPISGTVSNKYTDAWGNPTLVIENSKYQVMLLHGVYSVSKGDSLIIGQVIGKESNLGLTTDLQGRSCQGRDCGYHTHLNVFDKYLGTNVNPLDIINQ